MSDIEFEECQEEIRQLDRLLKITAQDRDEAQFAVRVARLYHGFCHYDDQKMFLTEQGWKNRDGYWWHDVKRPGKPANTYTALNHELNAVLNPS